MAKVARKVLAPANLDVVDKARDELRSYPEFANIWEAAKPYTMTSFERMFGLYQAVDYVSRAGVPGDFVECGVWRGGSSMNAALTLKSHGDTSRKLYLYDTYEGLPEPSSLDVDYRGETAATKWNALRRGAGSEWCYSGIDEVERNMASTGYPSEHVVFVAGKVEDTIPETVPERIAVLRLDTDWYESTRHELIHLYPKLVSGGVLILDDYGHWQGARRAVDEYFAEHGISLLLNRLDHTGRVAIKR